MKNFVVVILSILFLVSCSKLKDNENWIRVNQLGYLPNSVKVAVLGSKVAAEIKEFELIDAESGRAVLWSDSIETFGHYGPFKSTFRLNFSDFKSEGEYYVLAEGIKSPVFEISAKVYDGTADYLLNYMRQQRCGFNPYLEDSCHTEDGFIIYHPTLDSTHIDVTGGWHDASDYLQYLTTSANAVYQMLFAYQQNPESFGDYFDAAGLEGSNGIPDILDEAKWGLDWLIKMNPKKNFMFNQIADDRDHQGFRLPTEDSISYGKGFERPVYFCTGEPQGVLKHQNRADGIASTAGKYASSFALGSKLLEDYYPEFAGMIFQKAKDAYQFGLDNPGVCQTAPCRAPYFYEEDNYTDDMELAAIQLFEETGREEYQSDAYLFGQKEPVTPWMGADTANHYQWYPFVNLAHFKNAVGSIDQESKTFTEYLRRGIDSVYRRGKDNPFNFGVPFIWCSNNLVSAMLTQCRLYNNLTGDDTYLEMEAALRDWLFGCNPWGTSMIVGLPEDGDYPEDTHSAFSHLHNFQVYGGLVDGPVYTTIFDRLIGLKIYNGDEYAQFQSDVAVYHDDWGDYSTNEPTMDGTASLTFYLSSLEAMGKKQDLTISKGAVIRGDRSEKNIYLVFTGGDFANGYDDIYSALEKNDIIASFFFTGDFYRNPKFENLISELISSGHYLGAHSDKHLLYADWEKRDSTLITKTEFESDIAANYAEMKKFGINKKDALFYLPPFEWYNRQIANWTNETGLQLVNFTPGTISHKDYTIPSMSNYSSSEEIYQNILNFESEDNLNGFILLLHIGAHPERTDKFSSKVGDLLSELKNRGYEFKLIDSIM